MKVYLACHLTDFDYPELDGLEVTLRVTDPGVRERTEALWGLVGRMLSRTDDGADFDSEFEANQDRYLGAIHGLAADLDRHLLSWNLTDDDGRPVDPKVEPMIDNPDCGEFAHKLLVTWARYVTDMTGMEPGSALPATPKERPRSPRTSQPGSTGRYRSGRTGPRNWYRQAD